MTTYRFFGVKNVQAKNAI